MNWRGAFLYQLPFYYLIPLAISLGIVWISFSLVKHHLRRRWSRLLGLHLYYIGLSVPVALLLGTIDDMATATMFFIAVLFYGILNLIPILILVDMVTGQVLAKNRAAKGGLIIYSLVVLAVSGYSQFVEPYNIEVTKHTIYLAGAPDLKVIQISDIQTEYMTRREREVVEIVNSLHPDIILITGDYYSGTIRYQKAGVKAARYVLKNLKAKYGIFAISGSSNPYGDHPELFWGTPITYLDNENVTREADGKKIAIVGLRYDKPNLKMAFRNVDPRLPVILLYHSPSIAFSSQGGPTRWKDAIPHFFTKPSPNRDLIDYGVDLVLTGHTHGGQVCFPFFGPLLTGTKYGRQFTRGLIDFKNFHMYINRGLGMDGRFGPKVRFLARPEIAVFNIVGSEEWTMINCIHSWFKLI